MPIKRCESDGKPGWKWGDMGKCYTYDPDSLSESKAARKKALKQGIATGEILEKKDGERKN